MRSTLRVVVRRLECGACAYLSSAPASRYPLLFADNAPPFPNSPAGLSHTIPLKHVRPFLTPLNRFFRYSVMLTLPQSGSTRTHLAA